LVPGGASPRVNTFAPLVIAAAVALVHLLTNNGYGFHRDELQVLSDARHLDWGFVPYPPLTPFVERIGLAIFGVSLVGLRLFSVIAQALVVVVTGLMARELGGERLAQATAALAVALSALPLFEGTEFQYTTYDNLWWVLIALFVIRLLRTENPLWWLAIGATVGMACRLNTRWVFSWREFWAACYLQKPAVILPADGSGPGPHWRC
jgi:dolichyl-phosphate-mannose--protein O-mannosyl transferase